MSVIDAERDVRLFSQADGPIGRPPVLLLNSLGADHTMWNEVVTALDGGLRTLRFDARGHGASDAPAEGYHLERLAKDALAVLDAAGVERATFCGLSLGGLVALTAARLAPSRVARLVLANTALSFPPAKMWRERAAIARKRGLGDLVEPTLERWLTCSFRAAAPERAAEIGRMIAATDPGAYAGCCELLGAADLSSQILAVRHPVLVIVGDQDPSTPPQRGAEIAASLSGCRVVSLPAAHLSAVEAPEAFARALSAFAGDAR